MNKILLEPTTDVNCRLSRWCQWARSTTRPRTWSAACPCRKLTGPSTRGRARGRTVPPTSGLSGQVCSTVGQICSTIRTSSSSKCHTPIPKIPSCTRNRELTLTMIRYLPIHVFSRSQLAINARAVVINRLKIKVQAAQEVMAQWTELELAIQAGLGLIPAMPKWCF